MQIGDLIRFTESGYTGVILEFTSYDAVSIFITEAVEFANPTLIGVKTVYRTAEVVSSAERDPQG